MKHLTDVENQKVHEIKGRLGMISSPVLRLQAILQFSQIVDILTLGDTAEEERKKRWDYINELENKVNGQEGEQCIQLSELGEQEKSIILT